MERLYAVIDDNIVVEVVELLESDAVDKVKTHQLLIDATDIYPTPQVGWVFEGNSLSAPAIAADTDVLSKELSKMDARFRFGNRLCDELIKMLSAKNILLGKTSAQVNAIISSMAPIEQALRKCALPTALYAIQMISPAYPEYAEEFTYAVDSLHAFIDNESARS